MPVTPRPLALGLWAPCLVALALAVACGCGAEAVSVGPALGGAPAAVPPSAPPARPVGPSVDGPLARWVPAGFFAYGALGDLGPFRSLVAAPVDPAQLRQLRSRLPAVVTTGLAAVVSELSEVAVSRGLARGSIVELAARGAVLAASPEPSSRAGRFLVVAAATPELARAVAEALPAALPTERGVLGGEAPAGFTRAVHRLACGAALHAARDGDVFLLASDDDVLRGALKAAAGGLPRMADGPLVAALRPRLDRDACAFLVVDVPGMLGREPAWPRYPGSVAVGAAPGPDQPGSLAGLRAVALEGVAANEAMVVCARLLFDPASPRWTDLRRTFPGAPLRAPRAVGESAPLYVGLTMDLAGLEPTQAASAAALAASGPGGALAQAAASVAAAAGRLGLSWARDLRPWLGSEAGLLALWELRYPQAALLLATRDAARAAEAVTTVREALASQGQVFASRLAGRQRVFYTRYEGVDARDLEPSVAVTDDFVVLASGARAMEAALEETERLEGTPAMACLAGRLGARLHQCVRVDLRLLDRLLAPAEARLGDLTPANHGLCNRNLLALEEGRAHPATVECPVGGAYALEGPQARCSVHGTLKVPLRPKDQAQGDLAAVRHLRERVEEVALGAGFVADDCFELDLVLQPREPEDGAPPTPAETSSAGS